MVGFPLPSEPWNAMTFGSFLDYSMTIGQTVSSIYEPKFSLIVLWKRLTSNWPYACIRLKAWSQIPLAFLKSMFWRSAASSGVRFFASGISLIITTSKLATATSLAIGLAWKLDTNMMPMAKPRTRSDKNATSLKLLDSGFSIASSSSTNAV